MANSVTYDPEKFQLTIARFKKGGNTYEIAIDADEALAYRDGTHSDLQKVIQSSDIFADAQRGQLAPDATFKNIFGTEDTTQIAEHILKNGELHLTAEYKKNLRDQKRKQILQIIHTNGVDPKTNLPHPMTRIETALESVKIRVDEFEPAKQQAKEFVKQLREILPIRFEEKELRITIPANYAAKGYGLLTQLGTLKDSSWNNDGSLTAVLVIPGGLEYEVSDSIQGAAHGSATIEVIKQN